MTTATRDVARRVEHVMGMPISLALRGRHAHDEAGRRAWRAVMAELTDVDATFSTYRPDSWIGRLGRGEVEPTACPPEVHEVLAIAEHARRDSGGAFDVHLPDGEGGHVLDPSGVVKGWAVQRASRHLRALPDTDFYLGAGGDLVAHVTDADRPAWLVGVEDPLDPTRLLARVPVRDGAVATSGLTHRGAHIVDPRSGRTPTTLASVTVVAPDLTAADVDATAAFVLGEHAAAWLASRGRTGLIVRADGRRELVGSV